MIVLMFGFLLNSFFTDAPFVPVKKRVLEIIIDTLKLSPNSVLYDLGCGDARVLLKANESFKKIKKIGVEKNSVVYLWAKWLTRNTNTKIYCEDANKTQLKNATHIYLYLLPKIMEKLQSKIINECKPGTRIVSCDFKFTNLTPDEIINLPASKDKMCNKLYVYTLK